MLKDILRMNYFIRRYISTICQRLIKCGKFSYIKIHLMFLTSLKVFKHRLCIKDLSYNDGLQMVGDVNV